MSLVSLALEELSYGRYRRPRDLLTMAVAAVVENIGFRQLHAWWRLRGLLLAVWGKGATWEPMARIGFGSGVDADPPVPD